LTNERWLKWAIARYYHSVGLKPNSVHMFVRTVKGFNAVLSELWNILYGESKVLFSMRCSYYARYEGDGA